MDIEQAGFSTLKGTVKALNKYRPRLVISIYPNIEDFERIPKFTKTIFPGYQLSLGHYSMGEKRPYYWCR